MTDLSQAERKALADAANRIMLEPAFTQAMAQLRQTALEALVKVAATDIEAIQEHQAMVRAVDGLVRELQNVVIAGTLHRRQNVVS